MSKQVIDYIRQPDAMDNQSLDHLMALVEKYPYYHAARIMMLRSMYQMHDSRFDKQLKLAAAYLPSRTTIFNMFEGKNTVPESPAKRHSHATEASQGTAEQRTEDLINDFLGSLPKESSPQQSKKIDASQDYIAYLMQQEANAINPQTPTLAPQPGPKDLVTIFLEENQGQFTLQDEPENIPQVEEPTTSKEDASTGILTEAMAHIYIKQGKYDRAIEILRNISLNNPKKNRYFADQMRFLEKLIINQQASGNS